MRGFGRSWSGHAACWATLLALALTTIGLVAVAHRRAAAQVPPKVIVIEGVTSEHGNLNKWEPAAVLVAKGDTIQWKIKSGRHGIVFGPVYCQTAKQKLSFNPPLSGCVSGTPDKPGEVIVAAVVQEPLTGEGLHYHCAIHGEMSGKLEPAK